MFFPPPAQRPPRWETASSYHQSPPVRRHPFQKEARQRQRQRKQRPCLGSTSRTSSSRVHGSVHRRTQARRGAAWRMSTKAASARNKQKARCARLFFPLPSRRYLSIMCKIFYFWCRLRVEEREPRGGRGPVGYPAATAVGVFSVGAELLRWGVFYKTKREPTTEKQRGANFLRA